LPERKNYPSDEEVVPAPQGGNWQPVMRIDNPDQRRLIRLWSDIGVGRPDQLVPGHALASLGHARQPQIGAIGQDGGEESVLVIAGPTGPEVGVMRADVPNPTLRK